MVKTPYGFTIREIKVNDFAPPSGLLSFIICQFQLFLDRKPYIVSGKADLIWNRLESALELSCNQRANFLLAPEYSLPFSKAKLFADYIREKANENSAYCVPVEHLRLGQIQELANILAIPQKELEACFRPNLESAGRYARSIFNVAIIAIKDSRRRTSFYLQPKIFPALFEETENLQGSVFEAGRVINVIRSPLLSFAVTICFDFIGRDGIIPNAIRNWLIDARHRLDFLFILQVNPKPLHRTFERNLYRFANDPSCRHTSLFFVNCDSTSHLREAKGKRVEGFNKTAVLAKFKIGHTDEYTVEKTIAIPPEPEKKLGPEIVQLDWMQRLMLTGEGERVVWLKSNTLRNWREDITYPRKNDIHLYTYSKGSLKSVRFTTAFESRPFPETLPDAPKFQAVTIRKPPRFVGRSQEISSVIEFLMKQRRCLLIYGAPGIGKSFLAQYVAVKLLNESQKLFPSGLWFSSKDRHLSFKQFVSDMAVSLDFPVLKQLDETEQKSEIVRFLKDRLKKNAIIIFDNVETIRDSNMLRFISELARWAKIILTSRYPIAEIRCSKYELGPMSREDIKQLVQDNFPGMNLSSLQKLSTILGGSPFALNLLFGYLRTERYAIADEAIRNIESSGENIVDWIFQKAWKGFGSRGQRVINTLQLFADSFTEEALKAITGLPLVVVSELFEDLQRRFFIEAVEYSDIGYRRFQIHPLVRRFSEAKKPGSSLNRRYIDYYVQFVKSACEAEDLVKIDQEIRNVERALELCIEEEKLDEYLKLLSQLYYYFYERGFWNDTIDHCSRGYAYAKRLNSRYHSIEMAARVSWCAFRKEDIRLAKRWIKISKQELNGSKQTFSQLMGLVEETEARILLMDGKITIAQAQAMIQHAVERYKQLSSVKAITLQARALSYLGEAHLEQRDYQNALKMFTKVKELAEKHEDEKFAKKILAWTFGNLGETLLLRSRAQKERREDLETCANLFNDGLAIARNIDRRHTIAQCCWGLGMTLLALGDKKGKDYLSSAKDIYLRLGKRSKASDITAVLSGKQNLRQA